MGVVACSGDQDEAFSNQRADNEQIGVIRSAETWSGGPETRIPEDGEEQERKGARQAEASATTPEHSDFRQPHAAISSSKGER